MKIYLLLLIILIACHAHAGLHVEWELVHPDEGIQNMAAFETDGRRLYLGHEEGLQLSVDHGYTWRLTLPDRSISCIALGPNTIYAGTWNQGLYRSNSRGNRWAPANKGIPTIDHPFRRPDEYNDIRQIFVSRSGIIVAVGYHGGSYMSTDRAESWHDIYDNWLADGWPIGKDIWRMIEFGGYWWIVTGSGSVVISDDLGNSWKQGRHLHPVSRLHDWTEFDDELYAASPVNIGRLVEDENRWEDLGGQLFSLHDDMRIHALEVNRGRLFVGTSFGVYLIDRNAADIFIPAGLYEFRIANLVSHQDYLYAAVADQGIYRAYIPLVQLYGKASVTWGILKRGSIK